MVQMNWLLNSLVGMEMVADFTPQHAAVQPFPVFISVLNMCMRFECNELAFRKEGMNWGEHGKLGSLKRII